jgi:hypothetical protein
MREEIEAKREQLRLAQLAGEQRLREARALVERLQGKLVAISGARAVLDELSATAETAPLGTETPEALVP